MILILLLLFIRVFTNIVHFPTGAYGTVFKGKNRETQEIVALKRVKLNVDNLVRHWQFVIESSTVL